MVNMLTLAQGPTDLGLSNDAVFVLPDVRLSNLDSDVVTASPESLGADRQPSTIFLPRSPLGGIGDPKFGGDLGLLGDPETLCRQACDRFLLSLNGSRGSLHPFLKASIVSYHTKETITGGGG